MDLAALQKRLEGLKSRQRKGLRRTATVLIILIALIVIIRVILDPLATHFTRKAIHDMEGMSGDFQRVHVTIFNPGYEITRIKLWPEPRKGAKEPLFYAERVHVGASLSALLHGKLLGHVRVEHPKIAIEAPPAKPKAEEEKKAPPPPPDLSRQLRKATPLEVDRIEVFKGEVVFRMPAEPRQPEIWLHRLELAAENLATRRELAHGRPATVAAHGTLGDSGDVTVFVSADPLASPLSFAGRASVTGFRVAELYDLMEPKAKLQAPEGTADVFVEFTCKEGVITGGVKPVLKNVELRPTESGLLAKLKAWAADEVVELASDRVPGRNAVATVIPIKGKLTDPDIQLWPAVLGVVRNAFVRGLASGFTYVPPPTAEKKEGVLEQAKNAIKKDEGPPKAQPAKTEEKSGAKSEEKKK